MKKILIITYYWPPSGGAAVQRWLSFANKLSQKGWQVHLLTVDEAYATYQLRDESLKEQIHPDIRVHTTKTKEPFKTYTSLFGKNSIPKPAFSNETNPSLLKKISRFIRGNFFIPDPRKGWKKYALPKALELINTEKIDRVITAGPPHSTHFIGKDLKEKKGVYWIADFHDLWTDVIYYNMLYHLPFIKKKDKELELSVLESADLIITVGEKYKEKLLAKSSRLPASKINVLRIGYEESLFSKTSSSHLQEEFIITYTGTIADFYQPEIFINALKKLVNDHPEIAFRLRFVGVLSEGIKNKIAAAGLENILEETGYVSHKRSIDFLYQSSILLLINPVTSDEEMVIPGKIYEYLAVRKPVINITKINAETAGIIKECEAGKTFDRTMQLELEIHLGQLLQKWKELKNLNLTNTGNDLQYSRKEISNQLISLLEKKI